MISVDTFLATPWLLYTAVIFFSLCIGSFLNVVILRLPKMMQQDWRCQCEEFLELSDEQRKNDEPITLSKPASTCPSCGHSIRAWENVPVISYLVLGGKCASCKTGISPRYPMIEAITALFSVVTILVMGPSEAALWSLLLVWVLIALTVIDFDTQLLPDSITLPLLWSGLFFSLFHIHVAPHQAIIGALAGYLSLWSVYWLFKIITKKEGMGYGDFKLLAAIGAWLGWEMLPLVIMLSAFVGAIIGLSFIAIKGKDKSAPIPFGPFLSIAGFIALMWGDTINRTYLQFAGL